MRRVYVTMRGTRVSRQCLCVGTGSKPRTSTSVHWCPTFISHMNRARITFIPLTTTYKTCLYMECLRSVRVWTRSVSDSCVGRALDVRGILRCICSYASTCAICQWYVGDCKWYVRGSCVICQWFLPPTPRKICQFLDAQARTDPICAWFVSDSCMIGCVTAWPLSQKVEAGRNFSKLTK
jgi:hypothetical protein